MILRKLLLTSITSVVAILLIVVNSYGAMFEQMAVSTKAASLGNAVTAYPPGVMAVHYNPAGLTHLEGTNFSQGVFYIPVLKKTGKYEQGLDENGDYFEPFGGWFTDPTKKYPDPLAGTEGSTTNGIMILPVIGDLPVLIAPYMGVSYTPPGSRWTFAVAQYVPAGVGMEHGDEGDPNRFLGRKTGIQRMIVAAPSVGDKVTDSFSIGVSVGYGIAAMKFDQEMRTPNDMVALTGALGEVTEGLEIPIISELTLPPPWFNGGLNPYETAGSLEFLAEDFLTTSYNIGLLWEPKDWFSFGAVYQSGSDTDMSGEYEFKYAKKMQNVVDYMGRSPLTLIIAGMFDLPYRSVPVQKGTMTINIPFPARAQFGVMLRPIKRLRLLCDLNWTQWSTWENTEIVMDQKIQLLRFAKLMGYTHGPSKMVIRNNFKNTWHLGYGLEYQILDSLALRLGYEAKPTSVRDEYFGPVPMPDTKIYSVGLGLTLEDVRKKKPKDAMEFQHQTSKPCSVDFCFAYMTADYKCKSNSSVNMNSTDFTNVVYNPYAGLDVDVKIESYIFAVNLNFKW